MYSDLHSLQHFVPLWRKVASPLQLQWHRAGEALEGGDGNPWPPVGTQAETGELSAEERPCFGGIGREMYSTCQCLTVTLEKHHCFCIPRVGLLLLASIWKQMCMCKRHSLRNFSTNSSYWKASLNHPRLAVKPSARVAIHWSVEKILSHNCS